MLLDALAILVCAPANQIKLKWGLRCGYGKEQVGTHITALQVAVVTITLLPVAPELPLNMVKLLVDRAGTLLSMSSGSSLFARQFYHLLLEDLLRSYLCKTAGTIPCSA